MRAFSAKIIKSGTEYWMRVPQELVSEFSAKEHFSVRVYKLEPPYTTYVPTMETRLRRFGRDAGLTVPKALVTAGVLRHKMEVVVMLVPRVV